MAGTLRTKPNSYRTVQNFWTGVILLHPIPDHWAKSKMHTQAYSLRGVNCAEWSHSKGGEGRTIVTSNTLWLLASGTLLLLLLLSGLLFDHISFLHFGLCSNITSSERPSLTSPETESQKPSHSLILILL